MEMTLLVVALLATAGGLVVVAASGLGWVAAHRQDLLATGRPIQVRLHLLRLPGFTARLRPAWLFGTSTALGLAVITLAAVGRAS